MENLPVGVAPGDSWEVFYGVIEEGESRTSGGDRRLRMAERHTRGKNPRNDDRRTRSRTCRSDRSKRCKVGEYKLRAAVVMLNEGQRDAALLNCTS